MKGLCIYLYCEAFFITNGLEIIFIDTIEVFSNNFNFKNNKKYSSFTDCDVNMFNLFSVMERFSISHDIIMDKYKNKFRIPSARFENWDYGSAGGYFVTVCTKNRIQYFGHIENGEMKLNELGLIAHSEWLKTPDIRPDMNILLGEFCVMPDHFHGIVLIGENGYNMRVIGENDGIGKQHDCMAPDDGMAGHGDMTGRGDMTAHGNITAHGRRDAMHGVSTDNEKNNNQTDDWSPTVNFFQLSNQSKKRKNKFGPQSKNLGSIMRGFKSSVTTYARINKINFQWQELYHDHVIRNFGEYLRISKYIFNNPGNW